MTHVEKVIRDLVTEQVRIGVAREREALATRREALEAKARSREGLVQSRQARAAKSDGYKARCEKLTWRIAELSEQEAELKEVLEARDPIPVIVKLRGKYRLQVRTKANDGQKKAKPGSP